MMATPQEASHVSSTLEDKLSSLEAKYEELEKKYNTISAALLQKLVVENRQPDASEDPEASTKEDDASSTKAVKGDDVTAEPRENVSSNSRVRIVVSKVDPDTGERLDAEPKQQSEDAEKKTRAVTLRKITYSERESYMSNFSEIDIHDIGLWGLLGSELGHYPYHTFRGNPSTLRSPFQPLIHNWDKLQSISSEDVDDDKAQSRRDLKLLLDTISAGSGDDKLDRYLKTREVSQEQRTVTFDNLWTLFPPGELVYGTPFLNQPEIFLVQDCLESWPSSRSRYLGGDSSWKLLCWAYDWNGEKFYRSSLTLTFEPFDGQKSIVSLPFYPLHIHESREMIEETLVERGKRFRELCRPRTKKPLELGSQMFDYKGNAIFGRKGFSIPGYDSNDDEIRSRSSYGSSPWLYPQRQSSFGADHTKPLTKATAVDSRVMVDVKAYTSYGPPGGSQVGSLMPNQDVNECNCEECKGNEGLASLYRSHFDLRRNVHEEWSEEQYLLCPPRVLGYILRDKQWAQLQVKFVKDIDEKGSDEAWNNRLRLADEDASTPSKSESKTKELLLDLVRSHSSVEEGKRKLEVDDIIARKGKGLVILLYGPPGVGKTSTAETLALATRKPLFSVGVADVGTEAKHAEANLSKIFDLASSWQAILLIDEVDVFLESRQRGAGSSVDRNALVSVFLRVLEYYQGILILTTNQIAQFDVAVQSRIHIAIEYTSLKRVQKARIFDGFLRPLESQGLIHSYQEIVDWLEESVYDASELDGRQIRNIVTSALGLARSRGDTQLKKSHLVPVFRNTNTFKLAYDREFQNYINSQNKMIK